jgi:hypothetical protein
MVTVIEGVESGNDEVMEDKGIIWTRKRQEQILDLPVKNGER